MKRIEVCKMKVGDLKHNFGNPRKISKRKTEELERSMDLFGDFGIFLVDEQDNVIAGNQRSVILARRDPDIEVDVKRLIGYSEAELRSINIMDNTHAGEWDLELLADWKLMKTVEMNITSIWYWIWEMERLQHSAIPMLICLEYKRCRYGSKRWKVGKAVRYCKGSSKSWRMEESSSDCKGLSDKCNKGTERYNGKGV